MTPHSVTYSHFTFLGLTRQRDHFINHTKRMLYFNANVASHSQKPGRDLSVPHPIMTMLTRLFS